MKISDISISSLKASDTPATFLNLPRKTNRAKLAMIWVQEFDGERERLVAKWVTQD